MRASFHYLGARALSVALYLVLSGCGTEVSIKKRWVETNIGSSHSRRGEGKMGCSTTVTTGAPTMVKATLAFAHRPTSLTLKKANLVVKQ